MQTTRLDVAMVFGSLWVMLMTANVVKCLVCYKCNSTDLDCSGDQIEGKLSLQVKCLNADDECGLAFTIQPDTGLRRILNRTCWTKNERRDYEGRYGPELMGRMQVPSAERPRLMALVELHLSHCNQDLCNSRYPPDADPVSTLECYFCSSLDNPSCDFEGTDLKQMNETVLARCPTVGGPFFCAMTYKTKRNDSTSHKQQQQQQQFQVSRSCVSADDLASYKRQLGSASHLVGVDRDGAMETTRLFVCKDVSGCNVRFRDAATGVAAVASPTTVTWCYVCNDKASSGCSLTADATAIDESLVKACPDDQSYACVLWYKVQLETEKIGPVVRSCLSRDDAHRYRTSYKAREINSTTTSSSQIVYSKEDADQRAIYYLTMCSESRCNLLFPHFEPEPRVCYVCSQKADSLCDAEGSSLSSDHLGRCREPSDLCSLSYVVRQESGQVLSPSSVSRSCLSRRQVTPYQRHSSSAGDFVVIPGDDSSDQSIYDTHFYFCWTSNCNLRMPEQLRRSAPAPALRCFTCFQRTAKGPCGAQMSQEASATETLISRCAGSTAQQQEGEGEEQRCFMSYVLAADGGQSQFNRSCVSAHEILSLRRLYGPDLIEATNVEPRMRRYMYHCKGSLCNHNFPASAAANQPTIDCYICGDDDHQSRQDLTSSSSASSTPSKCGTDGSMLPVSLIHQCSVFDQFFCAVVAKYNLSSPEALLLSIRRHCISQRDAAVYTARANRLVPEERLERTGDVVVYDDAETTGFIKNFVFICRTNGCNANFPRLKSIVERHLAEIPIGVLGPVVDEVKKGEPRDEDYKDPPEPRHGASHSMDSAAQRPLLAIESHLAALVLGLVAVSSVFVP